jgi:hypothetical protein
MNTTFSYPTSLQRLSIIMHTLKTGMTIDELYQKVNKKHSISRITLTRYLHYMGSRGWMKLETVRPATITMSATLEMLLPEIDALADSWTFSTQHFDIESILHLRRGGKWGTLKEWNFMTHLSTVTLSSLCHICAGRGYMKTTESEKGTVYTWTPAGFALLERLEVMFGVVEPRHPGIETAVQ